MVFWLWVIAAILSFVLVLLVIKIFLLRRSALRLKEGLAYRLEHETNTLLDIPSRDGAMRDLASCLNSFSFEKNVGGFSRGIRPYAKP